MRRPLRGGDHRSGGQGVVAVGERAAQAVLVEVAGEGHALGVGAPHRPQRHHLLGPVDALGDGLEAEVGGDPQDARGDLVLAGRLDDPLDQAPVQFQYVHREPPQGVGGRVAAAEPVEGDPDAEPPQHGEALLQGVLRDRAVTVGQLQDEAAGGQSVTGQERLDGVRGRRAVEQAAGAEADDDGCGVAGAVAFGGLGDGLLQGPAAQLGGPVAVVRDAEELGRGEEYALAGAPAGLRGDGGDLAGGEVDDRLVEQGELAGVERGAEPGGQFGLADDVGLHLRGVEHDPVLAGGLGAVHGEVGVAQEFSGVLARFGEGDADAGGDADIVAVDGVGLGEAFAEAVGEFLDVAFAGGAVLAGVAEDEGGELVAAEAGGGVPGADGLVEAAGGVDEEFVTGLVADGVVDRLEAVQVDEEDGGAAVAAAAAGQGLADAAGEQGAVGQVGERVVLGAVL